MPCVIGSEVRGFPCQIARDAVATARKCDAYEWIVSCAVLSLPSLTRNPHYRANKFGPNADSAKKRRSSTEDKEPHHPLPSLKYPLSFHHQLDVSQGLCDIQ